MNSNRERGDVGFMVNGFCCLFMWLLVIVESY